MLSHQYKIRKKKELIEKDSLPFNPNNTSLKKTIIKEIDYVTAKNIIIEYEWLKTMPMFNLYYFGIYFIVDNNEYLGGVLVYSTEYSANKSNTWDKYGFTNKIILLSRGVCLWWTPKNTASYFISKTIKWLKKNTDYKIVTATVDPAANEIGTIYQSLNWKYVGLMSGNYNKSGTESKRFAVIINGKLRHSRSVRNELGTIKKSVILEKYPDAEFVPQYRKRRYFCFIGDKRENRKLNDGIKHLLLPYPKRNTNVSGVVYKITNLINNKKYIGITTRGFNLRYDEYKKGLDCCNKYVVAAFKKYGFKNFKFEIIDTAENTEELYDKEIQYIKEYDTTNRSVGYNIESGGINCKSHPETIDTLKKKKTNHKQNSAWVEKRVSKLRKRVVCVDIINNKIIEDYISLADAGRNNNLGLGYQQILRKCNGLSFNNINEFWCYYDDYINNTLPNPQSKTNREFSLLSDDEINKIIELYRTNRYSLRELSRIYDVNYSTLNTHIKKLNKPTISSKIKQLKCKKTGKLFDDVNNASGTITKHIIQTYPNIVVESKYKRKSIEMKTGYPWYYKYFEPVG